AQAAYLRRDVAGIRRECDSHAAAQIAAGYSQIAGAAERQCAEVGINQTAVEGGGRIDCGVAGGHNLRAAADEQRAGRRIDYGITGSVVENAADVDAAYAGSQIQRAVVERRVGAVAGDAERTAG